LKKHDLPSWLNAYAGKRVLVTGHTGFKGAWLCEWLLALGARVTGFSLPPPTEPSLFEQAGLDGRIRHVHGDLRNLRALEGLVAETRPDFIFHLAAQSLVRPSYEDPVETFEVNALGTAKLLEAARRAGRPCSIVAVTTDKCYENREWVQSYREDDAMGGFDPYSASKGAAELVIASYRRSFFDSGLKVRLASARSGNVIGAGDWARDRIVPDCIRHLTAGTPIPVRNPASTRPWQHVLEPLAGYLWLGACLEDPARAGSGSTSFTEAFNFGPGPVGDRTVGRLVEEMIQHWPGTWVNGQSGPAPHEASLLNLAIDKAWHKLGWRPVWTFETCVRATVEGYRAIASRPDTAHETLAGQIDSYTRDARDARLNWTL
jgi:CDP-glucose 4,6-dehydratase